ncbi:MAG: hypothetical protein A2V62_07740 [Nitrospirae bacterium RBG_19FT_COMBO_58_9]|nr:MAG: hypothetical protein A2V62_07740 [Nitrospirae bacterium RBG_19FT_COMBO_58_9]
MRRTRDRTSEAEERGIHHLKQLGHHGHVLGNNSSRGVGRGGGRTHRSDQFLVELRKTRQGADTGNQCA